jgi:hypothetical protein
MRLNIKMTNWFGDFDDLLHRNIRHVNRAQSDMEAKNDRNANIVITISPFRKGSGRGESVVDSLLSSIVGAMASRELFPE